MSAFVNLYTYYFHYSSLLSLTLVVNGVLFQRRVH
jgi:hypothetical protein